MARLVVALLFCAISLTHADYLKFTKHYEDDVYEFMNFLKKPFLPERFKSLEFFQKAVIIFYFILILSPCIVCIICIWSRTVLEIHAHAGFQFHKHDMFCQVMSLLQCIFQNFKTEQNFMSLHYL